MTEDYRFADRDDFFWSRVHPEPNTGCYLWSGASVNGGYGMMLDENKVRVRAHRWSFERFVRRINDGEDVCHRCDTPACVNPLHLFAGSHADNMADAAAKGRMNLREANAMSKLTDTRVKILRTIKSWGAPRGWQREIARRWGVTDGCISMALSGRRWEA